MSSRTDLRDDVVDVIVVVGARCSRNKVVVAFVSSRTVPHHDATASSSSSSASALNVVQTKLNTLSSSLSSRLDAALDEVDMDKGVAVVVGTRPS